MKNRKHTLKVIFFSVVSILVLTSMLLSVMLGSTNAALIKSLSKNVQIQAIPDLPWEYYIKDGVNTSGIVGAYKNGKNISQTITTSSTAANTIYRIAIPVDQEGYYTLSVEVDFWLGTDSSAEILTKSFDKPVGCQVVHSHQISITSGTVYSMAPDDTTNNGYVYGTKLKYDEEKKGGKKLLDAKDHYQWKTLAPSRKEKVDLSYYVDSTDITNGYVTWVWDFTGLANSTQYTLKLTDISVTRESPNDATKPYFEFMNTRYVNNAVAPTSSATLSNPAGYGADKTGYTRHNPARGTYVTNGTYNSLTMQASPLFKGWTTAGSNYFLTDTYAIENNTEKVHSNILVFNVPIKNVKKGTSYRVSFDFSVARQGNDNNLNIKSYEYKNGNPPSGSYADGSIASKDADYATTYNQFFNETDPTATLQFQSFLHNGAENAYNMKELTDSTGRQQVTALNKRYNTHWLTRYDEIMSVPDTSGKTTCAYTTNIANANTTHAQALNSGLAAGARPESFSSTYTDDNDKSHTVTVKGGGGINWLNAIRHSEMNGDNKINWLTFYNTSFTFNIDPACAVVTVGTDGYCNDLFWTWTIDAFDQTAWFRIKIDNVRIEEVVQYGSYFEANGMKLGDSQTGLIDFFPDGNGTNVNGSVLANTFRSANGTGQNFGARGYIEQILSATNIFGAIYDAGDKNINGNYKISLSGYCAAKGGVEKYVWSADGGKTWNDMTGGTVSSFNGSAADNYVSKYCEKFVDQAFVGRADNTSTYVQDTYDATSGYSVDSQFVYTEKNGDKKIYDHIDFQVDDGINSRFENITADLSDYKYQHNLDIIFAAVPRSNPFLRCEILRVINYNATKNYRTFTVEYESDIDVVTDGNKLNAVFHNAADVEETYGADESNTDFTRMYGINVSGSKANAGGYARRTATSHAYEDIRTLYSNMPVKKELTIRGWAIVEGGVEAYMWSADYGKTWITLEQHGTSSGRADDLSDQYSTWYSSSGSFSGALATNAYFDFEEKDIDTDTVDNGLKIDLSKYVGQVVDVIVVAKPNGSDALCPVSRIDNVAVYGDNGTFYSRVQGVVIDGVSITSTQVTTHLDGTKFANPQWTMDIKEATYSSLEPYHVRLEQLRFYNNIVNNISKGGKIKITGFAICHGGVKAYKYSFGGGETFAGEISLSTVGNVSEAVINDAGKLVDASFDASTDSANGYFRKTETDTNDAYLEFNIPENVSGEKNLLVVAEGNNGKMYPVLHMKLNIAS